MPNDPRLDQTASAFTRRVTNESELIQTYLAPLARQPGAFGLTDDAGLLTHEPGTQLVVTTDPIIAGVHFLPSDRADDIAFKALAVNASDLAAKGAEPRAYTLTLAFPQAPTHEFMTSFSQGLAAAQKEFGFDLIGGDTDRTPGAFTVGVTAIGSVPEGLFVRRAGAREGDHVFVTGTLGDAALGLAIHSDPKIYEGLLTEGDRSLLVGRYLRPNPRLALARTLRQHAVSALDISDGFLKDLARLAGRLSITVKFESLPLSPSLRTALGIDHSVSEAILSGGDDYEVLAAVAASDLEAFQSGAAKAGVSVTNIGVLQASGSGVRVIDADGTRLDPLRSGFDHFQT